MNNSNRRSFFKKSLVMAGAFSSGSLFNQLHAEDFEEKAKIYNDLSPEEMASNEDYWSLIQQAYPASSSPVLNLNNGGVSPSPKLVLDAVDRYDKMANMAPSYYMWRILDQGREPLRQKLADLGGCDPEEIGINRNATEALNSVIHGLDLNKGDEVIGSIQDYPNMMNAWKQRALREGIVYKQLSFDFPIEDDEHIVDMYRKAISPKTKIIHVTHVINWVGQIMPVKKICRMAHERGIEVIVDGAHSFGLLDFDIPDLEADYFGTSLHKYLSAPIGTGMMWIKKEHISKVWPLFCDQDPTRGDIRKFESLGTRSFPLEQGIGEAINFHNAIGRKRKEERARYLKNYWAEKAIKIPGVKLHTSLKPEYSCVIAGVSIDGMTPRELESTLLKTYKIHTSPVSFENIDVVRVSPHVYTKPSDLDRLVKALAELAAK
ncbi:aminotransferase class V-fold PLP-dependent enzyme [Cyclobacterium marinum]|uniref:Aminotransferase class V n=1 Tax=Cyclobacterium marinum (strain ATCC 25205 / DSM 745 / LMG 13164 / NCIMB 1802) TaxID=880070 RepID=G0J563_CYCMS|nr:aminotransferase class V-fold PLP-dependent enzyme [Cyclobacterium marinum]AEL26747.1 aminotransferase class V [Cyclobacterium marinum DSM 745]MBI0400095.1 aminotransferase class V-fold PLP-dependent enzyme [Cyclobacterium marinum]